MQQIARVLRELTEVKQQRVARLQRIRDERRERFAVVERGQRRPALTIDESRGFAGDGGQSRRLQAPGFESQNSGAGGGTKQPNSQPSPRRLDM